jgi:hypothetical protein
VPPQPTQLDRIEANQAALLEATTALSYLVESLHSATLWNGAQMAGKLEALQQSQARVKEALNGLTEAADTEAVQVAAQGEQIKALKEQIAKGSPATEEDLDALLQTNQEIEDRLGTFKQRIVDLVPDAPANGGTTDGDATGTGPGTTTRNSTDPP